MEHKKNDGYTPPGVQYQPNPDIQQDHARHNEPGSFRVKVIEGGEAKCCKGRMWTTEIMEQGRLQTTCHAEHAEDCKVENPPSAQIPVNPITRKREEPKAARAGKER